MTERQIRKLNAKFLEFGTTPNGFSRFRWLRTRDMHFLVQGALEETKTEGGLIVGMQRTYERHCYAEVYGDCWILACWQAPIPRARWIAAFGDSAPWPSQGEYHPIDNVQMPPGIEPNETHTEVACMAIRLHLKRTRQDLDDAFEMGQERESRSIRNEIYDEMCDSEAAFNNPNPGARGGPVSFGGINNTKGANRVQ